MEKLGLSLNDNDDGQMEFIEETNIGSSDEEDERKHSRMINAVKTLNGNRLRAAQRSEASLTVSEFSLCRPASDKLQISDLLSSLGKTSTLAKLKRNVSKTKKISKVLPPPLAKPEVEKIKRSLAYKRACKDVSKWDNIVEQNRRADHLSFPLKHSMLTLEPISKIVKRFKVSTPLEQEMATLLKEVEPKEDTKVEQTGIHFLNFEEAMDMKQTMRRLRAQQAAQEAKFRRRNKIKSKKYHRILRQEKLKKEMKEFEELQKTNPELAAEKLEELDRQRALERMSLRHRNTGKWAKYQMLRTKHNKESGQAIQEQIGLSRALTVKQFTPSDSDDELSLPSDEEKHAKDDSCNTYMKLLQKDSFNPWMVSEMQSKAICKADLVSVGENKEQPMNIGYRRYWDIENKKKRVEMSHQNKNDPSSKVQAMSSLDGIVSKNKAVAVSSSSSVGVTELSLNNRKMNNSVEMFDDDESDHTDLHCRYSASKLDEVDKIFKFAEMKQKRNDCNLATSLKVKAPKRDKTQKSIQALDLKSTTEGIDASYMNETLDRKQTLEDFENLPSEELQIGITPAGNCSSVVITADQTNNEKLQESDIVIDPHNFITVKEKVIKYRSPNMVDFDEDALDDKPDDVKDVEQKINIVEAFADDDVVEEFKLEKQAVIEREMPKDVDLTLPGWGSWGGNGISSDRPKKRFIKKAPPVPIRRDAVIGNLILNEKADEKLKPHMVKQVPFAFCSAGEFEKSIQTPLGKHWNPETIFRHVIAPKVSTKLGAIIEPMDADAITEKAMGKMKFKKPVKSKIS